MQRELADFIMDACVNNECLFYDRGYDLPELRENYQGRGERNSSAGIVCADAFLVMAAIACEAVCLDFDENPVDMADLAKLKQDQIGRQCILY